MIESGIIIENIARILNVYKIPSSDSDWSVAKLKNLEAVNNNPAM
jgi:hypothetical protein